MLQPGKRIRKINFKSGSLFEDNENDIYKHSELSKEISKCDRARSL